MRRLVVETPLRVEDLLAVACLTTAMCVMHGFRRYCSGPAQVLVSGGGVHNQEIMKELRRALNWPTGTTVDPLGDLGVPADAKEALAFALLAAATLDGEPSNVPSVTGAKRPSSSASSRRSPEKTKTQRSTEDTERIN
jgi:anhydro-N-acetylmuramic acid kinase